MKVLIEQTVPCTIHSYIKGDLVCIEENRPTDVLKVIEIDTLEELFKVCGAQKKREDEILKSLFQIGSINGNLNANVSPSFGELHAMPYTMSNLTVGTAMHEIIEDIKAKVEAKRIEDENKQKEDYLKTVIGKEFSYVELFEVLPKLPEGTMVESDDLSLQEWDYRPRFKWNVEVESLDILFQEDDYKQPSEEPQYTSEYFGDKAMVEAKYTIVKPEPKFSSFNLDNFMNLANHLMGHRLPMFDEYMKEMMVMMNLSMGVPVAIITASQRTPYPLSECIEAHENMKRTLRSIAIKEVFQRSMTPCCDCMKKEPEEKVYKLMDLSYSLDEDFNRTFFAEEGCDIGYTVKGEVKIVQDVLIPTTEIGLYENNIEVLDVQVESLKTGRKYFTQKEFLKEVK